MNSGQINFYLHPDDQASFEAALRGCGELLVLQGLEASTRPVLSTTTSILEMGRENLRIYLVRPQDIGSVCGRQQPSGAWTVDAMKSPVVEFSRCYFDGTGMRRGRLYAIFKYLGEDGQKVSKTKDFLQWARCLIKAARHSLTKRDDGDYVGPIAASVAGSIRFSL